MNEELDLLNDNRPIRYVETAADGSETVVYRASAIGGCTRALIAAGSAYEPMSKPGWFQEVLDEGSRMESVISAQWDVKTGIPTVNQQLELELEIGEINGRRVIVRCHIDGETDAAGEDTLREFKKFRPSTWPKFLRSGVECNVNYPWQVAIAMYAGGFEYCEFVGGQYDPETDTVISVEGKQIHAPPIPLKAIKLKIAKVERCINEGQHPSQTPCVSPLTYPCGYYYLHDEPDDDDDEIPAITDVTALSVVNRIVSTAVERAELNKRAKALGESEKYDLKLLKEILKVGDGDVGAGMAGKLKVEWGMSNGRKGYTVEDSPPAPFLKVHPLDKSKSGPKKEGK